MDINYTLYLGNQSNHQYTVYELCTGGVLAASIPALYCTVQILIDSAVFFVKHVHSRDKPTTTGLQSIKTAYAAAG